MSGDTDASRFERYLTYLDKEMTIVAALTAAAGGAFLYFVKEVLSGSLDGHEAVQPFFIVGLVALGVACLLFYLQRSHMVWSYGEITLGLCGRRDLEPALAEADSWSFWIRYRLAFVAIGLATVELLLAVLVRLKMVGFESTAEWLTAVVTVAAAAAIAWQQVAQARRRDRQQLEEAEK